MSSRVACRAATWLSVFRRQVRGCVHPSSGRSNQSRIYGRSYTSTNCRSSPKSSNTRSSRSSRSSSVAYRTRGQVTSPSLCRDAIRRLRPILDQHRGCNLIDVKPGDGPWSAHLVDALQPRVHVEVERRGVAAAAAAAAAAEPTGTVTTTTTSAASLSACFDPTEALLSPEVLAATNKGYTTANNDLVITANLSGAAMSNLRFTGSPASYFVHDLYAALFGLRDDVFRHGLARVIAWLPDSVARALMPRGIESRSKQSIKLEAAFDLIQIAGTGRGSSTEPDKRWGALEVENYMAVQAEAETKAEAKQDDSRKDVAPLPMLTSLPADPDFLRTTKFTSGASFVEDWLALDTELRAKHPDWFANRDYDRHPRRLRQAEDSQQNKWREYYRRAKTLHVRHQKIEAVVKMQREVDAKYRDYCKQGKRSIKLLEQINREAAQALAALESLSQEGQIQARKAIDDYRAYDTCPRALEWNKRKLDPLVVQADEFWPKQPLALVVLTPRPSFRQVLDTDSKVTCFDYVVNRLSTRQKRSVLEALQDFIYGPIEEFIETVPSLTDPVRGGCFRVSDLAHVRVRSLPATTFVDVAVAYEKWPLRPSTAKMMIDIANESTFALEDED